jgi:hypothetical protein
VTANIGFALSAAVLSLAIVIGAALKGHWVVAAVYALLVAGFLARAGYGRRARGSATDAAQSGEVSPGPPHAPRHAPERELRRARFRRR